MEYSRRPPRWVRIRILISQSRQVDPATDLHRYFFTGGVTILEHFQTNVGGPGFVQQELECDFELTSTGAPPSPNRGLHATYKRPSRAYRRNLLQAVDRSPVVTTEKSLIEKARPANLAAPRPDWSGLPPKGRPYRRVLCARNRDRGGRGLRASGRG
jgi:hypothetical protein